MHKFTPNMFIKHFALPLCAVVTGHFMVAGNWLGVLALAGLAWALSSVAASGEE